MIGSIQYGAVTLDMTFLNSVVRRPILSDDKTTYKFTEWVVDAVCVYNPVTNSFAGELGNTFPQDGNLSYPGTTDIAIRDYLQHPRRRLVIRYGTAAPLNAGGGAVAGFAGAFSNNTSFPIWLESPPRSNSQSSAPRPTDANNGPVCNVHSVVEHHGTKTWIIHLSFTTWLDTTRKTGLANDSGGSTVLSGEAPIIAHRWSKHEFLDQDYFSTIVTTGTVEFDVGRLWELQRGPDFYRDHFFHPAMRNYKREQIDVEVSEDNATASYTVIDRQQHRNLGQTSGASRLDMRVRTWYTQGSAVGYASDMAGLPGQLVSNALNVSQTGVLQGIGNQIMATSRASERALSHQAPKNYVSCTVRCWGLPVTTRDTLLRIAMTAANAAVGSADFIRGASRCEIVTEQDTMQPYVEFVVTMSWTQETWIRLANTIPGGAALGSIGQSLVTYFFPSSIGPNNAAALVGSNGFIFFGQFFPVNDNDRTLRSPAMPLGQNPTPGMVPAAATVVATGPGSQAAVANPTLLANRSANGFRQSYGYWTVHSLIAEILTQQGEIPPAPPVPPDPTLSDATGPPLPGAAGPPGGP